MNQTVQALIDVALQVVILLAAAKIYHLLMLWLAKHSATGGMGKAFIIAILTLITYSYLLGVPYLIPQWGLVLIAMFFVLCFSIALCSIPFLRSLGIAVLFVVLAGGLKFGATYAADYYMPGRWTLNQQAELARKTLETMAAGGEPVTISGAIKKKFAQLMEALAQLTGQGEAERLESELSAGLAVIQERREMLAEMTPEEIAAARAEYAAVSQELLGGQTLPTGVGTGAVSSGAFADAFAALEELDATYKPAGTRDEELELSESAARLMANLAGTNGSKSLAAYSKGFAKLSTMFTDMATNTVVSNVIAETTVAISTTLVQYLNLPTNVAGALPGVVAHGFSDFGKLTEVLKEGGVNLGEALPNMGAITGMQDLATFITYAAMSGRRDKEEDAKPVSAGVILERVNKAAEGITGTNSIGAITNATQMAALIAVLAGTGDMEPPVEVVYPPTFGEVTVAVWTNNRLGTSSLARVAWLHASLAYAGKQEVDDRWNRLRRSSYYRAWLTQAMQIPTNRVADVQTASTKRFSKTPRGIKVEGVIGEGSRATVYSGGQIIHVGDVTTVEKADGTREVWRLETVESQVPYWSRQQTPSPTSGKGEDRSISRSHGGTVIIE